MGAGGVKCCLNFLSAYGNLASVWRSMGELDSSFHAIGTARKIRDDFRFDYLNFLNHMKLRNIQQASASLVLMDKRIESESLSNVKMTAVVIISKFLFNQKEHYISIAENDEKITKLLSKYSGRLSEG